VDLYLAGCLAEEADQEERLQALGVDLAAARSMVAAASKRSFGGARGSSEAALFALFGRPSIRRVERLGWELRLWPEHLFQCAIHEWGIDGGEMVRRENGQLAPPPDAPDTLADALEMFRPWHHTRRDVERVLGDPLRDSAWYPRERYDWRLAGGDEVTFDFNHGLLLRVRRAAPAPAPAPRRRPWWAVWRS
jgi:hypothetical protein